MFFPGLEIVLGLALKVVLWLALWLIGAIWRTLRSAIFDHPLLTLALLGGAQNLRWFVLVDPQLSNWLTMAFPFIVVGLALVAIARFVAEGGPAAVKRDATRTSRFVRDLAVWGVAHEWVKEQRAKRDRPPPPLPPPHPGELASAPIPMGPASTPIHDVQVEEVPDSDVELVDEEVSA